MAEIGDIFESRGEITIEWKVSDFFSLSEEKDVFYYSPKFYFSGASWSMQLYPNGQTMKNSEGWLDLYLLRMSNGSPVTVNYALGYKTDGEKLNTCISGTRIFIGKLYGWGVPKIMQKSIMMEKKSDLAPSDTFTMFCTINNNQPFRTAGSLFNRHQKICDNLHEIYIKGKGTDCTLKVDGQQIPAHRMILETQSPVFAAMFNHDTKENQTGEISINDLDKNTMHGLLIHMYTGDINILNENTALPLYAAAEKYDIKDVKDIISEFIVSNLSVDWVCDVIKFAELYGDEKVTSRAREYFRENARKIMKTERWMIFSKENPDISVELLASIVAALLPE